MPITVACPSCGQAGKVPDHFAGQSIRCPKCQGKFPAPPINHPPGPKPATALVPAPHPPGGELVRCPHCSEPIRPTAQKCRHCGEELDLTVRAEKSQSAPLVASQAAHSTGLPGNVGQVEAPSPAPREAGQGPAEPSTDVGSEMPLVVSPFVRENTVAGERLIRISNMSPMMLLVPAVCTGAGVLWFVATWLDKGHGYLWGLIGSVLLIFFGFRLLAMVSD